MEKLVIMGAGCAGLTAAIYAARANLTPLVLTGAMPGGLLTTTIIVENYPGFAEGIDGYELMVRMQNKDAVHGAGQNRIDLVFLRRNGKAHMQEVFRVT